MSKENAYTYVTSYTLLCSSYVKYYKHKFLQYISIVCQWCCRMIDSIHVSNLTKIINTITFIFDNYSFENSQIQYSNEPYCAVLVLIQPLLNVYLYLLVLVSNRSSPCFLLDYWIIPNSPAISLICSLTCWTAVWLLLQPMIKFLLQ